MDSVFFQVNNNFIKIAVSEIMFIEGRKNYALIHNGAKKLLVHHTLKEIEEYFKKLDECLPVSRFCKIHKSYIIALSKIKSFNRRSVSLEDGTQLPLSARYLETLKSKLSMVSISKKKMVNGIPVNGSAVLKTNNS